MQLTIPLRGGGGEPVDLWRTLNSHGMTELPPMSLDDAAGALEVTLPAGPTRARTVRISAGPTRTARVEIAGRPPGARATEEILALVSHILRLDEDLSGFYAMALEDPELAWAAEGAGRMVRSATVFEDVVKTICTTNCTWSATERMVGAIVEHLGVAAPGAPEHEPRGRAFPSPEALAAAPESFLKDVARAGYRSSYLRSVAASVADGSLDLERLVAGNEELSDDEVESELLALPGVGPYAAAHIMMTLGRHSRLILDSWTRPKYARLTGKRRVSDAAIERRFRSYGRFAGLAFWLFLTRDWVEA
ncbi:MAG: DNA-3-methyladenine glycosylase family protein [Actinomycetota bacterium]